jgi:hypothetical protein
MGKEKPRTYRTGSRYDGSIHMTQDDSIDAFARSR